MNCLTSSFARVLKTNLLGLFVIPLLAFGLAPSAQTAPAPSGSAYVPVYPLKVGGDGRHLVDQNNVPFMILGDSPQALIVNLSEAEAAAYFADRQAVGFNTVWINLLCNSYTGGNPNGTTYDGIAPFTTAGDLSTPNPAYFQRVDHMINLAAQYGLTVILDPIETGGWLNTLANNGATKDFNYGVYLGNRYKTIPNIIWMHGNDFQSWGTAGDDALVVAVANGIRSVDSNHIHTVELSYYVSSSLDDNTLAPAISLNAAYTYYPTYAEVLHAYNQSRSVPAFMVEANYEFEGLTGMDYGSPATLRRQEYWTQLSGATGQLYGNHYTWQFLSGWQDYLDTTGAIQFGYMKGLFASRRWYSLVPDQNHTVVIAGYGTFATSGSLGSNDYLTAARTPDGSLVIAYMPTFRSITVDMSKLSGPVTAEWFDPTNNTYVPISSSAFPNSGLRQFTPPSMNSAGDGDWILVLETTSTPAPSPPPVQPLDPPSPVPSPGSAITNFVSYSGDFNKDGKEDILWRNTQTGKVNIWFMNGASVAAKAEIGTVGLDWRVIGIAPFNGDAQSDILWQNTDGRFVIWIVHGTSHSDQQFSSQGKQWSIVGAADLDRSGFADILWRNVSTGELVGWKSSVGLHFSAFRIGTAGLDWDLVGAADLFGNGQLALIWRNQNSGKVAAWQLRGGALGSQSVIGVADLRWTIVGFGDFNGDGRQDILWRSTTDGSVIAWSMNGFSLSPTWINRGPISKDWQIRATPDVVGNHRNGILWSDVKTGEQVIWTPGGSGFSQARIGFAALPWAVQR